MTNFKPITAPILAPVAAPPPAATERPPAEQKLFAAAQKLEATFLAEMLKSAGFGEARKEFGGGAGEEHFASFLTQAHAEAMVENGGIGLAQSIFEALKESQNDDP